MTFVKIGDKKIPALIITNSYDHEWDGRESATIIASMSHEEASNLFVNDAKWSVIYEDETAQIVSAEIVDEDGNSVPSTMAISEPTTEYDYSDFCIAGTITDHRDGKLTIKMGKMTELEEAYALMYGGANNE